MGNQYAIAAMEQDTRRQALQQEAVARAAQLQAEQQMNEMKLAAQKEQLAQEMMLKDQELSIDKFYKTGMLGLNQKEVDQKVKQAAREFEAQDQMQREIERLHDEEGLSYKEAYNEAAPRFAATLPASVQSALARNSGGSPMDPQSVPIEGTDTRMIWNGKQWVIDPNSRNSLQVQQIEQIPGYYRVNNSNVRSPVLSDIERLEKRADALDAKLSGDEYSAHRKALMVPEKEQTASNKALIKDYQDAINRMEALRLKAQKKRDQLEADWGKPPSKQSKASGYRVVGQE